MKSRSPSKAWKSICGLANERVERLEEQRKNVQARLVHLAAIRAEYSNLITTVRNSRRDSENRRSKNWPKPVPARPQPTPPA